MKRKNTTKRCSPAQGRSSSARAARPSGDRRPTRWIIHPGYLAGDGWHVVAALLVEPDLRVALAVLTEIRTLWHKKSQDFNAFLPEALRRLHELDEAAPPESEVAMEKGTRNYNAAGQAHRRVRHWQETIALLESIAESGISFDRVVLVPGMESWEAIDNPYLPARRLVEKHNAIVGIEPNDLVGMTQASTSCVARRLHKSRDNTIDQLRSALAPVTDPKVTEVIKDALSRHLDGVPPNTRVLVVMMRRADENRQHNTTRKIFKQLVALVEQFNTTGRHPYKILPIDDKAARTRSAETSVESVEAECVMKPFNVFGLLEEIDRRTQPARATRSLVAEFWRVIASMERVSIFGGRSGSLDIAAFMGVRRIYCFDVLQMKEQFLVEEGQEPPDWAADHENIRLFLTWRLMTIGFIDHKTHLLDQESVLAFLRGEDQDPAVLGRRVQHNMGYAPVLQVSEALSLKAVTNAGKITDKVRRWALLTYLDNEFPISEDFFRSGGGGGGGSSLELPPAPDDVNVDAAEGALLERDRRLPRHEEEVHDILAHAVEEPQVVP